MLHDQQLMVRSEESHPIQSLCSPDLEYLTLLCWPFWLPREFTAVTITAVYIPPQADTDATLKELYWHLCTQETVHPDAAFIITRDFNKADLRRIAPKFSTRGWQPLNHGYTPFRSAYKSLPHPPLGKSASRTTRIANTLLQISTSLPDELNTVYARFEVSGSSHTQRAPLAETAEALPLSVSVAGVTQSLQQVNIRKATGPDSILGRVLKTCAHQLAGVFTDIFNLSLSLSFVPQCFKTFTIVPIQKTPKASCLNDWRPVALTPIISKCFVKLIRDHICSVLQASAFAFAFAFTLHTALSHLDKRNTYVRMLFVDYSSAFNTIVPSKLVVKLRL